MIIVSYPTKDMFRNTWLLENKSQVAEPEGGFDENTTYVDLYGNIIDFKAIKESLAECVADIRQYHKLLSEFADSVYLIPDKTIPTLKTDGLTVYYSPVFVQHLLNEGGDEMGNAYVEYVIIHELCHMMLNHCYEFEHNRKLYGDHVRANCAMDYEVNALIENFLVQDGELVFKGMGEKIHALYDEYYFKQGWTWTQIYPECDPVKAGQKEVPPAEWIRGFLDGYNRIYDMLQKQGKIE